MRTLIIALVSISLGGCASTIEAWKGRSFGSHNFRPNKIYVASADRRLAITGLVDNKTVICPELSPEIAVSRSAESTPSITLSTAQSVSFADAIKASQMKAHEMDSSSQKLAMLHWTLCTAYLNGTLDKQEYKTELLSLVQAGKEALTVQAGASAKVPSQAQSSSSTSVTKTP